MLKPDKIYSPRSSYRVVDMPFWYGGNYDLSTGRRGTQTKYSKSAWAYACMQLRGTELANLPWKLVKKSGKVVESHPVIDLLNNFGSESNWSEAVLATEIDLLIHGKAFWLRDVDILKRLNASTIAIKADASGIQEFIQTIDGKVVNRFSREEVVYFREFHPDTDLQAGVAVLDVVKNAVDTEVEAQQYVIAFFKNDATPSLLLTTEQDVQEEELNRLLTWFNNKFKGSKNAHKVGAVARGLTAQPLSSNLDEMALVEIRDQARSDICVGFRVPKILVGSMEEATYANAQEARKFMIEDLIIPRGKYYADVINADLVHAIDSTVTLEFSPEELQILQEDANTKWERLSDALARGVISPVFARSEMGWSESDAPLVVEPVPQLEPESDNQTLRAWQKKAKKALKRGESANVPFETEDISPELQLSIRSQLESAQTPTDIEKVFSGPSSMPIINVTVPEKNVTVNLPEIQVTVNERDITVNLPETKVDVHVPQILESVEQKEMLRDIHGNAKGTKSKITHKYGE